MSKEEKTVRAPEKELVDPIETMVREWLNETIKYDGDEEPSEDAALCFSVHDLGTFILNCFDSVQDIMIDSIIPPGTTIH